MKPLAEKLVSLESQISREKGAFALFALFLREEMQDRYDLVVSSSWIEEDKKAALDYLAERLRSFLEPQELLSLSKIVLVDLDNPSLRAVNKAVEVEHGLSEVRDDTFFGLEIKHAYIITSKKQETMADSGVL